MNHSTLLPDAQTMAFDHFVVKDTLQTDFYYLHLSASFCNFLQLSNLRIFDF